MSLQMYKYYMLMRPFGPGCQPRGSVDMWPLDGETVIPEIGHHAWAIVWYERRLTDEELRDYEMVEAK